MDRRPGRVHASVAADWDRIIAVTTPGGATEEAPEGQPAPAEGSVAEIGELCVVRTGRRVATAALGRHRIRATNPPLVEVDRRDGETGERTGTKRGQGAHGEINARFAASSTGMGERES